MKMPASPQASRGGFPAAVLAAAMASAVGAGTANAQDLVPDAPTCPGCSIAIERRVRIGDGPESVPLPGGLANAGVDARGRYWLVFFDEPIMVFDEGGGFVGTAGGIGDGPGELRYPGRIAMTDDAAIVLDSVTSRAIVFDLDLQQVRTVTIRTRRLWDMAAFGGSASVLISGLFRPDGELRLPLTIVDLTSNPATAVRTFGPDLEDRSTEAGLYRLRHVFDAPADNTIWVAEQQRYHVSKWSADGELLDSLMRQPEWFSGFSRPVAMGGPETAPHPQILDITSDSAGRLWVFAIVAGPHWRETWSQWIATHGMPLSGEVGGGMLPSIRDLTTTMVEVLDPQSRRVVHRQTLDAFVINALPGPRIVTYSEPEPDFEPIVEILSLRLDEGRR